MTRRFLLLVVICLCPGQGGCFLPWAVPSYSRCPGTTLQQTDGDEVVAVFVRAEQEQYGTAPRPQEVHTLQRVAVADGKVPSQVKVYLARGYVLYLGLLADSSVRREYCLTKLYRRGYKTTVVIPSREPVEVRWERADTPDDQERAVRDLVYRTRAGDYQLHLSDGSADPRHREVLLFAAAEFERVADLHPSGSEPRKQCLREARDLRDRADK